MTTQEELKEFLKKTARKIEEHEASQPAPSQTIQTDVEQHCVQQYLMSLKSESVRQSMLKALWRSHCAYVGRDAWLSQDEKEAQESSGFVAGTDRPPERSGCQGAKAMSQSAAQPEVAPRAATQRSIAEERR